MSGFSFNQIVCKKTVGCSFSIPLVVFRFDTTCLDEVFSSQTELLCVEYCLTLRRLMAMIWNIPCGESVLFHRSTSSAESRLAGRPPSLQIGMGECLLQ